jgi:signal peptidase II
VSQEVLQKRSYTALVIMLVSLAVYTFLDIASKEWALDTLSHERVGFSAPVCQSDDHGYVQMQRLPNQPKVVIDGYFNFHYAENCGAAFGFMRTAPTWLRAAVFGVAAIGACIVLTMMFMRGVGGPMFAAAVPMILSGAIGNLSDRFRHGFVVDFIQVDPRWFEYPTFNVADCTITIGVALLLIDGMGKRAPAASADPVPASSSAADTKNT